KVAQGDVMEQLRLLPLASSPLAATQSLAAQAGARCSIDASRPATMAGESGTVFMAVDPLLRRVGKRAWRHIRPYRLVGAPSAPMLLLLRLLPYEISRPPLMALMPVPLRLMELPLRRAMACCPSARIPVPPLLRTALCSTTTKLGKDPLDWV